MNSYGLVALAPNTGCISPNHESFYGLTAFTPGKAIIMNRMHLTKTWKFRWFDCIHTRLGYNNEKDASHQTLQKLRNSHGLAAFTPGKGYNNEQMYVTKP